MEGSRGKISVNFRWCKTDGIEYQGSEDIVRLPRWACVQVSEWVLSCVRLFAIPWTVAHQTPLSMGFSRQEYWNWMTFPPPGPLPDTGFEPVPLASPALISGFFTTEPPGKPKESACQCRRCKKHHWLNGHELEQTPGESEGQGSLACCMVAKLDWTTNIYLSSHVVWKDESAFLWRLLLGNLPVFLSPGKLFPSSPIITLTPNDHIILTTQCAPLSFQPLELSGYHLVNSSISSTSLSAVFLP